jgi:hypothetical protein
MKLLRTTMHHNTNILPLRWLGNACEMPASWLLMKCVWLSEDGLDEGLRYKVYSYISNRLYKPYFKWGTYYTINNMKEVMEELNNDPEHQELMKRLGSDYDENGIPYWDKWKETE